MMAHALKLNQNKRDALPDLKKLALYVSAVTFGWVIIEICIYGMVMGTFQLWPAPLLWI